ncbi:MAG: DNA mismatch repair endonuclease MutL [Bacteroidia bacterium]
MSQIIQLLPEHVANQIAAGEVVQRPSSAVKELMENAVDAGADTIQLIIKDGGRSLIQVIDNGCGMSDFDARLCFARHATSKIRQADDLWQIRTMGFRGEAMASIAAIAQIEMQTRLKGEELGTLVQIEGSDVKSLEPCACAEGTSISIKNLFFNVPARRNFLKSNPVETRHIIDEFQRVAMAFPEISFSMINNGQEVYRLPSANFKQRIVGLFGATMNQKLLPLNEDTSVIRISGFIGKPEAARKTRGEQFFFINNRFIKNSYLNHAISSAFQDLITSDNYPVYFIRFEIDPRKIDVNIHPTKTEIKFEDERSVYAILKSTVRKSIASFSLSPTLDFEYEQAFDIPLPGGREIKSPDVKVNPEYNPFNTGQPVYQRKQLDEIGRMSQARWDELAGPSPKQSNQIIEAERAQPWMLHGKYICCQIKSGLMLIDFQRAIERVTFENFLETEKEHHSSSQQLLFPVQKEFNASDYALIDGLIDDLKLLGFDLGQFGNRSIAIQGVPPVIQNMDVSSVLDKLLEEFKNSDQQVQLSKKEEIAKHLAKQAARHAELPGSPEKMMSIVDKLFACSNPNYTPSGKAIINTMSLDELASRFTGA